MKVKKILSVVIALMMVFAAGAASATMDTTNNLILAIYNTDLDREITYEMDYGIGEIAGLAGGTVLQSGIEVADMTNFLMYSGDYNTGSFYFTTTSETGGGVNGLGFSSFTSALITTGAALTEGELHGATTQANSVNNKMNGVSIGSYSTFNADPGVGEASTEDLLAAGDYVDVYLYNYAVNMNTGVFELANMVDGQDYMSVLRLELQDDGTATMSTVPVPGAVWLLGSALLGLVGLRRRNR
jgi:hypothetical protein